MPITVRRARGEDWSLMREIRLEALASSPLAFASTLAREQPFTESDWRARIESARAYLAFDGERVLGTATGFTDPADPDAVRLVAMYVRIEARATGCADRLIDAVVAGARQGGADRLITQVAVTNPRAARVYERYGFVPTGARSTLPHSPDVEEIELVLDLT